MFFNHQDPMLDEPSAYHLEEKPSLVPEILQLEVQNKPDEDVAQNEYLSFFQIFNN